MSYSPQPFNVATGGNSGVPPMLGGTLGAINYNFVYNTTAETTAFTLPAGATIIAFRLVVDTTFNNTPTLSVGITGTAAYYLSAASVLGTAGPVYSTAWLTSGKWNTRLAVDTAVTVTVGGTPNQGSAWLIVEYAMI